MYTFEKLCGRTTSPLSGALAMPLTGREWYQSCYTELGAPSVGEPLLVGMERINIYSFMLWVIVLTILLLRASTEEVVSLDPRAAFSPAAGITIQ